MKYTTPHIAAFAVTAMVAGASTSTALAQETTLASPDSPFAQLCTDGLGVDSIQADCSTLLGGKPAQIAGGSYTADINEDGTKADNDTWISSVKESPDPDGMSLDYTINFDQFAAAPIAYAAPVATPSAAPRTYYVATPVAVAAPAATFRVSQYTTESISSGGKNYAVVVQTPIAAVPAPSAAPFYLQLDVKQSQ